MKKYLNIFIPVLISIGCFLSYQIIGSHVEPDGRLVEPFALIPIGYFFFLISLISILVIGIKYLIKRK